MDKYVKIAVLKNEIQAGIITEILSDQKIPHVIISYHDSAYDGLWQMQKGWGHIDAPEEYRDEIISILNEINKS